MVGGVVAAVTAAAAAATAGGGGGERATLSALYATWLTNCWVGMGVVALLLAVTSGVGVQTQVREKQRWWLVSTGAESGKSHLPRRRLRTAPPRGPRRLAL